MVSEGIVTKHDLTMLLYLTWGTQQRFHIAAHQHFNKTVTAEDRLDERILRLARCFDNGQITAASQTIEDLLDDYADE